MAKVKNKIYDCLGCGATIKGFAALKRHGDETGHKAKVRITRELSEIDKLRLQMESIKQDMIRLQKKQSK